MNTPNELKIYDGDYLITFSEVFNVYTNELKINNIAGFEIFIKFLKNNSIKDSPVHVKGDNEKRIIIIELINFHNSLGAALSDRLPIIETINGKNFYISIHSKGLNEESSFLQVSVTIYFK